jgi:hypothetical protein
MGTQETQQPMNDPPTTPELPAQRPSLAKRVRLPRLSGKASAAWLVICFLLTGVLVPMTFQMPIWIAFEIVLGIWWALWLGVLARLLYTGQRVTDDHQLPAPRSWFTSAKPTTAEAKKAPPKKADPNRSWWDGFFWGSVSFDGEAIAVVIGLIVLLILLLGLIWFLFEIAIPVVLFLLYFVTRGMLAAVVNDRHHCRGRAGQALLWGLIWATMYTAPLAGAVWFIHAVHQSSVR